jgi:hypothetical protein
MKTPDQPKKTWWFFAAKGKDKESWKQLKQGFQKKYLFHLLLSIFQQTWGPKMSNNKVERFLVRWVGRLDSNCTWITRDILQQLDPDLWEYYQSRPMLHSTGSSFSNPGRVDGDTRPTPQTTRVYGRRRRRMTQPVTLWFGD